MDTERYRYMRWEGQLFEDYLVSDQGYIVDLKRGKLKWAAMSGQVKIREVGFVSLRKVVAETFCMEMHGCKNVYNINGDVQQNGLHNLVPYKTRRGAAAIFRAQCLLKDLAPEVYEDDFKWQVERAMIADKCGMHPAVVQRIKDLGPWDRVRETQGSFYKHGFQVNIPSHYDRIELVMENFLGLHDQELVITVGVMASEVWKFEVRDLP